MKRREFLRTAGGAAGATAAGGAATTAATGGAAALQENETEGGEGQPQTEEDQPAPEGQTEPGDQTGDENQSSEEAGGGTTETVTVGPGGDTSFDPAELAVEPGTTVVWEWDSDQHNVNPTSVPDDAEWEGYQSIEDSGFSYEHTFEVLGTYEYQCDPHAQAGMVGTIEVTEDAGEGGGGGHQEADPAHMGVPIQKHFVGAGAFMGIFSTLVFIFYVLKYGESAHTSAPGMED